MTITFGTLCIIALIVSLYAHRKARKLSDESSINSSEYYYAAVCVLEDAENMFCRSIALNKETRDLIGKVLSEDV